MTQRKIPMGIMVTFCGDIYIVLERLPYTYMCSNIVSGNVSNLNRNSVKPFWIQKGDIVHFSHTRNTQDIILLKFERLISKNGMVAYHFRNLDTNLLVQYSFEEINERLLKIE